MKPYDYLPTRITAPCCLSHWGLSWRSLWPFACCPRDCPCWWSGKRNIHAVWTVPNWKWKLSTLECSLLRPIPYSLSLSWYRRGSYQLNFKQVMYVWWLYLQSLEPLLRTMVGLCGANTCIYCCYEERTTGNKPQLQRKFMKVTYRPWVFHTILIYICSHSKVASNCNFPLITSPYPLIWHIK